MNLYLARADCAWCLRATERQLDLGQALDGATLGADEVGMRPIVIVADGLEAPHVIAHVGAASEPGLGEIDEVAVDRRAIPGLGGESIRDVAVRHRSFRGAEKLEYSEPRRRRSQPAFADDTA